MSRNEKDNGEEKVRYEGPAALVEGPLSKEQTDQRAQEQRDNKYKGRQLLFNFLLVLVGAIGLGIGSYQVHMARLSADAAARAVKVGEKTFDSNNESFRQTLIQMKAQATAMKEQVDRLNAGVTETHALAKAAQDALTLNRTQFNEDQRPYIWVGPIDPPSIVTVGQRAVWNFHFFNYGRSPAINMLQKSQVVFGEHATERINRDFFDSFDRSNPLIAPVSGSILPPNDLSAFSTAISNEVLSSEDLKFITDHDAGIMLLVYFEYFDARGTKYHAEVCKKRLKTGSIAVCDTHNKIY